MNRHWIKNQDNSFTFFSGENEIGNMNFRFSSADKTISFNIGQKHFSIERKGFWGNILLVTDTEEQEILKVYPEKWYANHWMVNYDGKNYQLLVRNNPLAEYVISDGKKQILAYGLKPNGGKVQAKITAAVDQSDFILDFLIWYLFAPVAQENIGDSLNFFK